LRKNLTIFLIALIILLISFYLTPKTTISKGFDETRSFADLVYQVNLDPRIPGSIAHAKTIQYIGEQLKAAGWAVNYQQQKILGIGLTNVIGSWGESAPWVLIGAHYDSRIFAERDPNPEKRKNPVPGANDGASGVAAILELARIIPSQKQLWANKITLALFDAEDNGDIEGWEWIMGSQYFVEHMGNYPDYVVVIDMIGDSNLNIYYEANSNLNLSTKIWNTAAGLGYSGLFIPKVKYKIIDDQIPFVRVGIPTAEIIDFDYPYWHTTEDVIDKVSSNSLKVVGDTLLAWLNNQ
jgi:Zn-dependent M28 family amino/carboxypeptidase